MIDKLYLEIIISRYPIKSVKFAEHINIYLGIYNNNTFSTKEEYHFTLSSHNG